MLTITENAFKQQTENNPYWTSRWDLYLGAVCDLLIGLPVNGEHVLEIGPYTYPLIPDSIRMDSNPACARCVRHDAGKTPWPFADNSFCMVVACQVWEHLQGRQHQAFQEAERVCGVLLLTVPWQWDSGCSDHQNIDEKVLVQWSGGLAPLSLTVTGRRAIAVWEFGSKAEGKDNGE